MKAVLRYSWAPWRSVESNQSFKERQNPSLRGLCERRRNREPSPIGQAPDSVRSLTRVQYPSRVNEKGYGGWLKAWVGTKMRVEVKQTPGEGPK